MLLLVTGMQRRQKFAKKRAMGRELKTWLKTIGLAIWNEDNKALKYGMIETN